MTAEPSNPTDDFLVTSLTTIRVEHLFGDLDHDVRLRGPEGLTIIHGPNGVGKTTLLRIVDCIFKQSFRQLAQMSFSRVVLHFDTGASLQVSKQGTSSRRKLSETNQLEFIGESSRHSFESYVHDLDQPETGLSPSMLGMIEDVVPFLDQIGSERWIDERSGDILNIEDVVVRYGDYLPLSIRKHIDLPPTPPWLAQMLQAIPTAYIRAQRLSTVDASPGRAAARRHGMARETPTVNVFSDEIRSKIASTLARYAEHSQSLDSTFPTRVLDRDEPRSPNIELRQRYELQAERRSHYVSAGLLDDTPEFALPEREFDIGEQRVLATYFDDIDQKLDQLADLASKVSLFREIVNGKFRRKELAVSRQHGFVVTNATNDTLPLRELSSGEQQELVLAYELLFRHPTGTLVLIDEPELSLHISWQMAFIDDLLKVSELTGLRFIVATHSPQIIGDRWDLTDELRDY